MKRKKHSSADFPKKKQKLGKGKRPPENATNVSFKAHSVVVPTQLEQTAGPSTHRKLTLQDLFKHLSHPKSSVRRDALTGLRELFITSPSLLLPCLSQLTTLFAAQLVDHEESVRHALYLLLKCIYQTVPSQQMAPFIELTLASVKCAITHIKETIRLSGMKVVDLLLTFYPELVQNYIYQLLPFYLPLVTSYTPKTSGKVRNQESYNIISKSGSIFSRQSSRLQVFQQLLRFLTLLTTMSQAPPTRERIAPILDVEHEVVQTRGRLSSLKNLQDYLHSSSLLALLQPDQHFPKITEVTKTPITFDETGFINRFIQVLLEYWIETIPSIALYQLTKVNKKLTYSTEIIETVLQLLCLLLEITTYNEDIDHKLTRHVATHFLPYFPLFQEANTSRPSSVSITLNIQLSYLLVLANKHNSLSLDTVLKYLDTYIPCLPSLLTNSTQLVRCVKILTKILDNMSVDSMLVISDSFYTVFVKLFIACHPISSAKQHLLLYIDHLLTDRVISHDSLPRSLQSNFLYPCLSTLPDLLIKLPKPVNRAFFELILRLLNCAAALKIEGVLRSLYTKLYEIYDFEGIIMSLPSSLHLPTFHLLGHLSSFSSSDLSLFCSLILSNKFPILVSTTLLYLLHNRLLVLAKDTYYTTPGAYPTLIARHISFLISILIGYSEDQLRQLQRRDDIHFGTSEQQMHIVPPLKCEREQEEIIKVVVRCLMGMPLSNHQLITVLEPSITKLLHSNIVIPLDTSYALLYLVSQNEFLPLSLSFSQALSPLLLALMVAMATNTLNHPLVRKSSVLLHHMLFLDVQIINKLLQHIKWIPLSNILIHIFLSLAHECKYMSKYPDMINDTAKDLLVNLKENDREWSLLRDQLLDVLATTVNKASY